MTRPAPSKSPPAVQAEEEGYGEEGGTRPFDWAALVAQTVHPVKVAIVEALRWVEQPLSATELTPMFEEAEYPLDMIVYHARGLLKLGSIEIAHSRQGRGACERFYTIVEVDRKLDGGQDVQLYR